MIEPNSYTLFFTKYYPANVFVLKMKSADYVCCIHSNALQNTMKANTMNPDYTTAKGEV